MPYADLQDYLAHLDEAGLLYRVSTEVDKDWELSCICRWMFQGLPEEERKGILFERVKGFDQPVAVGVLGASRQVYAAALGVRPEGIYECWGKGLKNRLPPRLIGKADAPVKQRVSLGEGVDLTRIPIPLWTPGKDGGPYLTSAAVITRDPDSGIQNCGTYRIMLRGPRKMGIGLLHYKHISVHHQKYKRLGRPMPVAVVIGGDPSLLLASVSPVPYDVDEVDVAGGLRGAPIDVVQAETSDLLVPARAEYVLEGVIPPDVLEPEGPFGEWVGTMGVQKERPIIEVLAVTQRHAPVFHGYLSQMPPSESSGIRGYSCAAILYQRLVHDIGIPGVIDTHFPDAGGGGAYAIVQIDPKYSGHARQVGLIAASLTGGIPKVVTVVDKDINIRDPFAVEWARVFRVNPAKDILIVPDTPISQLDASVRDIATQDLSTEKGPLGSKLIIDATKKTAYPPLSLPPVSFLEEVRERWTIYGLPPIKESETLRRLLDEHNA